MMRWICGRTFEKNLYPVSLSTFKTLVLQFANRYPNPAHSA